jgi:hypothetical protein
MKTGYMAIYDSSVLSTTDESSFCYFHNIIDVVQFYQITNDFRLFEIEDLDSNSITNEKNKKVLTNNIRIIREIPKEEYYHLFGIKNNILTVKFPNLGLYWEKRKYNNNNNCTCLLTSEYFWEKRKYDNKNNCVFMENSDKFWVKRKFDENNNEIYYESSSGRWVKREFDEQNNVTYYEDSFFGIVN